MRLARSANVRYGLHLSDRLQSLLGLRGQGSGNSKLLLFKIKVTDFMAFRGLIVSVARHSDQKMNRELLQARTPPVWPRKAESRHQFLTVLTAAHSQRFNRNLLKSLRIS